MRTERTVLGEDTLKHQQIVRVTCIWHKDAETFEEFCDTVRLLYPNEERVLMPPGVIHVILREPLPGEIIPQRQRAVMYDATSSRKFSSNKRSQAR